MADTNRARTALEALFPDNTSGDISPQDLRDFLRSVQLLNVPRTATGTTDTLVIGDADNTVLYNSADSPAVGCTVTIPANASVAFPIGTKVASFRKSGLVTFSPAGGVTLNKPTGIKPNRLMGALVRKASDQTTANYTSGVSITWDQETYDTDAFHDTGSNTDLFTIPSSLGITRVRLTGTVTVANGTIDQWNALWFTKGGSASFDGAGGQYAEIGATTTRFNLSSANVAATAADTFGMTLQIEADTSVTITAAQSSFGIEVTAIDAVGTIAYQYGMVWLEKIGTDEWNIYGPALG